ncbi:MAG: anti-sigma factor [Candidatus Acidiferrum sp.]|jgi:anti-sigma factor RsiW
MSCDRADAILHAYFDNELDAVGAAAFESHLGRCSECLDEVEALHALRSSMNLGQLYEKAPASLCKKVLADLRSARTVALVPDRSRWQWFAVAAGLLLFAYTGWQLVSLQRGDRKETLLAAKIVDAHLRSLQPGHLTDVVSSDQHTVKPWFDGKVDFSPPVRDFADRGFPLEGGRLDIIDGRATAALIYGRRKHLLNVFIWPTSEQDASPRPGSRQGYQWLDWRKGGMEFWVVSDAAPTDLEQLQRLFSQ